MNNAEFYKNFVFAIYKRRKYSYTDNSKGTGSPANFVALMIKGTAVLKSRYSTVEIKEGDIFFIPKNELYQSFWYGDENGEIEFLSLSSQNLPINNVRLSIQKIDCPTSVRSMLDYFFEDITVNCKSVGIFYSFLGEVISGMERKATHYELVIEKALDYMYANPTDRTKSVAEYCSVSEATLYNIFSKNLNKTPNEIKQQILCEKAAVLLTTTTLSIEEISTSLHFSSSSYFRKILKRHMGKTPSQLRKENFM